MLATLLGFVLYNAKRCRFALSVSIGGLLYLLSNQKVNSVFSNHIWLTFIFYIVCK